MASPLYYDVISYYDSQINFSKKNFFCLSQFEVQQCSAIVSRVRFYSAIHEFVTCLGFNIL